MKKNCHHQRPWRRKRHHHRDQKENQKLYNKGHQGQEEQQEDPSVTTISLQISRDNFDDVKLYF